MDRLINYLFWIIAIFLFVLEGKLNEHLLILIGLGLSLIIAYLAFFLNWITLDATKAVIILGTITFGFGGIWPALALIFFFLSSSLITRNKRLDGNVNRSVPLRSDDPYHNSRRDGYQVWGNGFWVAVFCLAWFQFEMDFLLLAVYGTIAAATADTWATEMGTRKKGGTRLITTFKKVEPGTDGGISFAGTLASAVGSMAVASLLLIMPDPYDLNVAVVVAVAGFVGSVADSYMGAIFQTKNVQLFKSERIVGRDAMLKNCLVNWLATGIGGLITLITFKIMTL
ncbi:DUF92 domain-containing protein [Rhodohalobacter sp.]|uniref:DUF92 domain-containing protein n=1 Tax=Rhodohalobacter sp. TaxID=1974210 RepID=UPI002ACE7E11|nr:DUF92 domain-containing protein [Rhodohalobacter sp.]MDZ7755962.1 DUF92 domain-containing protein [Rhodohalobacter sp.]